MGAIPKSTRVSSLISEGQNRVNTAAHPTKEMTIELLNYSTPSILSSTS